MDSETQKVAEKQIREVLIEPLNRLGLLRPSGVTIEVFGRMCDELARKLAYMAAEPAAVEALREMVQASATATNRWPAAVTVLDMAGRVMAPPDDASPLIRRVFGHAIGAQAIAEGFAPELLMWLRRNRQWPGGYALDELRRSAGEAIRKAATLEGYARAGETLTAEEAAYLERRRQAMEKCRQIAALTERAA